MDADLYLQRAEPVRAGHVSNRVSATGISGSQALNEAYGYDLHGNMTSMPQLQAIQWNFQDQPWMSQRQAVNADDADGVLHQGERTYYVYDGTGQRARKVTESPAGTKRKERFYLDGYEVYSEYDNGGAVTLQRDTLHVTDDRERIAMVETRTQGTTGRPRDRSAISSATTWVPQCWNWTRPRRSSPTRSSAHTGIRRTRRAAAPSRSA